MRSTNVHTHRKTHTLTLMLMKVDVLWKDCEENFNICLLRSGKNSLSHRSDVFFSFQIEEDLHSWLEGNKCHNLVQHWASPSSPFCFLGQGGQCRAYRGYLVAVAAAVVCMRVWSLALSPCPAHNAVVHTERGAKGPRAGWPLLQRWPRGRFLWPARDWTWQLWGRLLCKCQFTIVYLSFHRPWRLLKAFKVVLNMDWITSSTLEFNHPQN